MQTKEIIEPRQISGGDAGHRIVCIGASAGGMEAIHQLFDHIPPGTGFSFIVIQHLSSDHKSLMAELLAKHTTMTVVEALDRTSIHPDTVYVIPNNKNITVREKQLFLSEKEHRRTPNMPIDVFLTSLAKDVGRNAVAVILSGTGTDGTKGIAEVKRVEGLVFVQDPSTAQFDGMPASAINSGKIDFILSPESIAEELLMPHTAAPARVIVDSLPEQDEPALREVLHLIHSKNSVDYSAYKRPTIIRRLIVRMASLNCNTIYEYIELLKKDREEIDYISKDLLVGVTRFFRDTEAFEDLRLKVIPEIVKSKAETDTVKVWVPACSTGEEVYSIAILIREHLSRVKSGVDVKIFGTDLKRESIDFASKGYYPETIVSAMPKALLAKYFIKEGNKFKVVPQLRKMIVFSPHDLLKDPPFGKLDLISCRNMLIYLSPPLQKRTIAIFHFSLALGGYLFLGPSETIGDLKDSMVEINRKWRIYKNLVPAKSIGINTVSYAPPASKRLSPSPLVVTKEVTRKGITETILNQLVDECSMAGAMVDSDCNIIETFGDYRGYLQMPEKKFDHNFLKMLPARAAMVIGSEFTKAILSKKKYVLNGFNFDRKHPSVNITIKPFQDKSKTTAALIFFQQSNEDGETRYVRDLTRKNRKKADGKITLPISDFMALQAELVETREILQRAIEEAESTNEELQSSNEQLISSNEELQSTNEELQSLNEELHTVNSENQLRIKEISDLNDDLNNYFRSADIGQVFIDKNLLIRKYTPAATSLVNLVESDIGRPLSHISDNILHSELINDVKQVLRDGDAINRTIELEDDAWYQMKILPYLREAKNVDGAVLIFLDVTGIKRAERAIKKANQDLKELNESLMRSNRELEQFAYITSHDLQEPLRKIQTFANLTEVSFHDVDTAKKYLDKINKAANRMSLLIKDVLSYSRLTVSPDRNFEVCDLNQVLNSVVEDFEYLIQEKKATIRIRYVDNVKGIPLQLQQLFSNLVSNSLKFCEQEPQIEVKSEKVENEEAGRIPGLREQYEYIKVTFSDNGIGFEGEYAEKIFTIFQRLNSKDKYEGTGIGLALCKRIVENHDGAIFATSVVDCGATFIIYLPSA